MPLCFGRGLLEKQFRRSRVFFSLYSLSRLLLLLLLFSLVLIVLLGR